MKKRLIQATSVAAVLLMLIAIGGAVFGGSPDDAKKEDIEFAKRTAQPARAVEAPVDVIAGNGVVEPNGREIKVAAQVAGRVASLDVAEGAKVEKDAVLLTLDSAVEKAALSAAEAELRIAQAELARTLKGQRKEDVDAAVEETRASEARAEQSQAALERIKTLAAKGGATPDELDKATAIATADRATARASEARMRGAISGSRAEDVLAASARAEAARARRDQARASLDRLTVRAPIAGEVLQLKFRPGEYYVPGGEPLAIVGDTSKLMVRMDVDERDIARVKEGASAKISSDAFGEQQFTGRVVEIGRRMGRKNVRTDDPTERKDTKILEVVIALDAPAGLVPGQRVVARVAVSR